MNKEEASKVIELVVSCYPKFVEKKHDSDNPKLRIKLLQEKLLTRSFEKTWEKVNKHIETSPYEPKISEILPPEKYKPDYSWKDGLYDD